MSSSSSSGKSASKHQQPGRMTAKKLPVNDFWLLKPSPFENRRPTIRFTLTPQQEVDRFESVPTAQKKKSSLLYFRIPDKAAEYNVVKNGFKRAGFAPTNSANWNAQWAKHLQPSEYAKLNPYQKVNHFPGSFVLGRKDFLWRNIAKMRRKYDAEEWNFHAHTYLLPGDRAQLENEMSARGGVWICKPAASSCGRGIKLISKPKDIPESKKYIAQRYISRPLLINGFKFDLRLYVAMTCVDPLRIYFYEDGLARFCTEKYRSGTKDLDNQFCHLTNYSVNRKAQKFIRNEDESADGTGSKWSLKALKEYLQRDMGIDVDALMLDIEDVIIKTILCAESDLYSRTKQQIPHRNNCFELFGFDVLIDKDLKPWVLEVNIAPSLSSGSPMDKKIKGHVVTNLFDMLGFVQYNRKKFKKEVEEKRASRLLGYDQATGQTVGSGLVSPHKRSIQEVLSLDFSQPQKLTDEELEVIVETAEEEFYQGGFHCIFPRADSRKYLQYFDASRYNNHLLVHWRESGCGLREAEALCAELTSRKGVTGAPCTPQVKREEASVRSRGAPQLVCGRRSTRRVVDISGSMGSSRVANGSGSTQWGTTGGNRRPRPGPSAPPANWGQQGSDSDSSCGSGSSVVSSADSGSDTIYPSRDSSSTEYAPTLASPPRDLDHRPVLETFHRTPPPPAHAMEVDSSSSGDEGMSEKGLGMSFLCLEDRANGRPLVSEELDEFGMISHHRQVREDSFPDFEVDEDEGQHGGGGLETGHRRQALKWSPAAENKGRSTRRGVMESPPRMEEDEDGGADEDGNYDVGYPVPQFRGYQGDMSAGGYQDIQRYRHHDMDCAPDSEPHNTRRDTRNGNISGKKSGTNANRKPMLTLRTAGRKEIPAPPSRPHSLHKSKSLATVQHRAVPASHSVLPIAVFDMQRTFEEAASNGQQRSLPTVGSARSTATYRPKLSSGLYGAPAIVQAARGGGVADVVQQAREEGSQAYRRIVSTRSVSTERRLQQQMQHVSSSSRGGGSSWRG